MPIDKVRFSAVLATMAISLASSARADFVVPLTTVINGATPNTLNASKPFLSASFVTVTNGDVIFTVSAENLTTGEFVASLMLNCDPTVAPSSLTFTKVSGPSATVTAGTDDGQTGGSQYKAGKFDVLLTYAGNGQGRFTTGSTSVYEIKALRSPRRLSLSIARPIRPRGAGLTRWRSISAGSPRR
jgi:hypothetical protein